MIRNYRDIFINEELFTDFYFYNVGYEACQPEHAYGPNIRDGYVIHYVVDGQGTLETDGHTYHLKKGNFFLIRPDKTVFYYANPENPWTYYWFGFDGDQVIPILSGCNIQENTVAGNITGDIDTIAEKFEYLISAEYFNSNKRLKIYSVFFDLFYQLDGGNVTNKNLLNQTLKKKYSDTFMLYVKKHYMFHNLTIAGIAKSMNLNSSYLSQVIKDELGIPPMVYLKKYRLYQASILLEVGEFSVSEVAEMVGYESVPSFSRVFKESFGQAPSHYKGQH